MPKTGLFSQAPNTPVSEHLFMDEQTALFDELHTSQYDRQWFPPQTLHQRQTTLNHQSNERPESSRKYRVHRVTEATHRRSSCRCSFGAKDCG